MIEHFVKNSFSLNSVAPMAKACLINAAISLLATQSVMTIMIIFRADRCWVVSRIFAIPFITTFTETETFHTPLKTMPSFPFSVLPLLKHFFLLMLNRNLLLLPIFTFYTLHAYGRKGCWWQIILPHAQHSNQHHTGLMREWSHKNPHDTYFIDCSPSQTKNYAVLMQHSYRLVRSLSCHPLYKRQNIWP